MEIDQPNQVNQPSIDDLCEQLNQINLEESYLADIIEIDLGTLAQCYFRHCYHNVFECCTCYISYEDEIKFLLESHEHLKTNRWLVESMLSYLKTDNQGHRLLSDCIYDVDLDECQDDSLIDELMTNYYAHLEKLIKDSQPK